jgi:hypothetical protein
MQMKDTGIFIFILLVILAFTLSVTAGAAELGEYEIKSGMLYNFTNFIEWPAESLDNARTLSVCIAGEKPANQSLYRLQGKRYKDRMIVVRQVREPLNAIGCNLLFIHGSEISHLTAYLQMAQKRSILTVSDMENFAANGGIIGFIEQDRKVRFEINLDAARYAKIVINSQLLKLARIVSGRKN